MKLLGDGFARTGIAESLEIFHLLHFHGQLFQERSCDIAFGDLVFGDDGVAARSREHLPDLGREGLVRRQTLGVREGFQGLLRVFTELAVDFSRRESSPVQQNLELDDGSIHSVIGGKLGAIFGVIDGGGIQAGCHRRQHQPAR